VPLVISQSAPQWPAPPLWRWRLLAHFDTLSASLRRQGLEVRHAGGAHDPQPADLRQGDKGDDLRHGDKETRGQGEDFLCSLSPPRLVSSSLKLPLSLSQIGCFARRDGVGQDVAAGPLGAGLYPQLR